MGIPVIVYLRQLVRWFSGRTALGFVLVAALALPQRVVASAEGIVARTAALTSSAEGYRLDAAFDIRLSPGLRDAITRGIPVHFLAEFELSKERWYRFDPRPIKLVKAYTLTYVPLLRQYRLSAGNASQSFSRLEDALQSLSRIRAWPVADGGLLQPGESYQAALRLRLDTAQLPKPLQLNAVSSQAWSLTSEWYRWSVDP